jgi:XTP/dITP diphosphohydrolase
LTTSPARFVAHVALAGRGRILAEATGLIAGEIAQEPRGSHGFGYDPIFYYPPYGCTLGEVDGARKAAVSHRGQAFRQLRDRLIADPRLLDSLNSDSNPRPHPAV